MPSDYLLDSNIAIALLNGHLDLVGRLDPETQLYVCPAVVAELLYGALKSAKVEANTRRVQDLARIFPVLPCTYETARQFAAIQDRLRRKGRPIPINDQWIAAAALEHRLVVATRDGHFGGIEGLPVESW